MKPFAAALLSVFVLSACSPDLSFPVKDRWSKSVRNLALQPVYPMREDVFVGTLRIVSSRDEAFSLRSRSLGYVDIHRALVASELGTPDYPVSGSANSLSIGESDPNPRTAWSQPTAPNALTPDRSTAPDRLRLAAIPGVSLVRISEADFASRTFLRALATSFRRDANLNINLKGVETLEIDDISATIAINNGIRRPLNSDPWFGEGVCMSAVALGDHELDTIQIQMVTRVFYARAIDYIYGDDASAALRQARGSDEIITSGDVFAPSTTEAGAEVEGQESGPAEPEESDEPVDTANVSNLAPGTVSKVAVRRKDGSTLTEVFERPLAFGVGVLAVSPKAMGLECSPDGRMLAPRLVTGTANLPGKEAVVGGPLVLGRVGGGGGGGVTPATVALTGEDRERCDQLLAQNVPRSVIKETTGLDCP